jgi:hypothetical protein
VSRLAAVVEAGLLFMVLEQFRSLELYAHRVSNHAVGGMLTIAKDQHPQRRFHYQLAHSPYGKDEAPASSRKESAARCG